MNARASKKFKYKLIAAGVLFAVLWSSAAVATKIGLQSAQPFMVAIPRFFIAVIIMLLIVHIILKKRLPAGKEWKQIAVYGLMNISIYLGLYVVSMQYVSAGIGSLSVTINPVLISLMASIWLNHPVKKVALISLLLCCAGIFIAAWPLFKSSYASPGGLFLLFISTISYSAAAVYFSKQKWNNLHILAINGWQTLFGGIFLLPVLLLTYNQAKNHFDFKWMSAVLWLAIMVSILAVQLWLFYLKYDAVQASFWLFLCPVSGFIIAAIMLHEPISVFTITGVLFVTSGLYLIQKKKDEKLINEIIE